MAKKNGVFVCRLVSALALCALILSCSNAEQDAGLSDDTPTLRNTAGALSESTVWTEEIEIDRLSAPVSAVGGISSRLNLTPLIVLAAPVAAEERVFPSLGSFGSLDTTLIPPSLREMLASFSECISKNKDADSFMAKDGLYSLALFYNDFERIFKDALALDSGAEKSAEAQEEGEEAEESAYFSSFVLGQPFLDGVYYEVPVKFFSDKATLTLSVFCVENAGSWKVDQLQIADWELF